MTPQQDPALLHPSGKREALAMLSPNSDDPAAVRWWIQWFDIYQWPHVRLFDSWQELCDQLRKMRIDQLFETSRRMRQFATASAKAGKEQWRLVFNRIRDIFSPIRDSPKIHRPAEEINKRLRQIYGADVWPVGCGGACLTQHPQMTLLFDSSKPPLFWISIAFIALLAVICQLFRSRFRKAT